MIDACIMHIDENRLRENVAFPFKEISLCLYLLLTAMTRHHASDGRTDKATAPHTDLRPQASFVAGFVVPRGHISANLPVIRAAAPQTFDWLSPRPDTLVRISPLASIIDRVRRAFRSFVSRITVGWVTHRFHSVTNSVSPTSPVATGVISVGLAWEMGVTSG